MNNNFDEETVRQLLTRYPYLYRALGCGLIARKQCQMILGVKKSVMDDVYVQLMRAGAIKAQSTSSFRATEATLAVMQKMEVISKFDEELTKSILTKYPLLKVAFRTGLVSRRLIQAMLEIDKGEMDDLYVDLMRAGAVKILASSAFRANEECINVIAQLEGSDGH